MVCPPYAAIQYERIREFSAPTIVVIITVVTLFVARMLFADWISYSLPHGPIPDEMSIRALETMQRMNNVLTPLVTAVGAAVAALLTKWATKPLKHLDVLLATLTFLFFGGAIIAGVILYRHAAYSLSMYVVEKGHPTLRQIMDHQAILFTIGLTTFAAHSLLLLLRKATTQSD